MKKIIFFILFLCIVSWAYAQEVSTSIKSLLSSEGKILYGNEPNSIVVIDYPENMQRIEDYLKVADVMPQQVMVQARVIEVKLQGEHSLGINWEIFADKGYMNLGRFKVSTPSALGGLPGSIVQSIPYKSTYYPPNQTTTGQESPFTIAIFDDNINIVLQALANALDTNILSAPQVTTVNNREAEIKIIQSQPWAEPQVTVDANGNVIVTWSIHFEEVGITLKVTPTVNENGEITMLLNPEISEKIDDYHLTVQQGTTSVPYTVPIIDKRTASTKVVIGDGQTLIIGGLIKDKTVNGETKVPFLGDIPGLGYLFKSKKQNKDKTELLIFVSPSIIKANDFVKMANQEKHIYNPDYFKEKENREKMLVQKEVDEAAGEEDAAKRLESLTKKHNVLFEERKKLEKDIARQEADLGAMEETVKKITQEKKNPSGKQ